MKFVKKMPKTDKDLSEQLTKNGWNKIKEPHSMGTTLLASIPLMLVSLGLTYSVVYPFHNLLSPIQQFMAHGFSFTINLPKILGA